MPDEKRKPGRPRKWSSDAERMRAARASKREERRVAEERRAVRRAQQERRTREKYSTRGDRPDGGASTSEPVTARPAPSVPDDVADAVISNQAEVDKLRAEIRRLEDEFDDVVYDRWIFETQYRMAVHRMRRHDPDGLAWLDEQIRRWEIGREGTLEQRRRARRSWETGRV